MKNTSHKLTTDLVEQEQYSIARKMLSHRFSVGSICRITQLSSVEVETLKSEVNRAAIAQETLDQLQTKQHDHNREVHLLATKKISEKQAQQQAPWLFEDDWYLGWKHHQRLGAFTAEA
jgi:hypothetical protein